MAVGNTGILLNSSTELLIRSVYLEANLLVLFLASKGISGMINKICYVGFVVSCILLIACSEQKEKQARFHKQPWKVANYLDSTQILLTNEYSFKNDSYGIGASSFLLLSEKDTLLCTARHLLGSAMGIYPTVKTDEFNDRVNFWKAYPRNDKLSADTIWGRNAINEKISDADILLQKCSPGKAKLQVLKPRFTNIKSNEELEIISCEYGDSECHQRSYEVILDEHFNGSIRVRALELFSPRGMSGSPVIDKNGYVIGVLVGGGMFEGKMYLTIELLTKVRKYLVE